MQTGRALMFQGTSSHVGKSVVSAGFCRILLQDGYSVAPFKSQNMSNNSCITGEGGEIGRAQWVQAEAAGKEPSVLMNPVLIKPKADAMAQVVFLGRPAGDFEAGEYRREFTKRALPVISDCLGRLLSQNDAVVIEGAGSPAEINLKDGEIVNMSIARIARSPVLLVADIDRGGVFASLVGTLELLDPDERDMVRGFIINKFRGSIALLEPGLQWLTQKTGKPVLGVLPYLPNHDIPDEDAVSVEENTRSTGDGLVKIAVCRLPRISNFTDFDALKLPGVTLTYAVSPRDLDGADCIIIPGTKNTVMDLKWLHETGLARALSEARGRLPVIGICGGYQMLGRRLYDPEGTESLAGTHEGFGFLDVETSFASASDKTTTWSKGTVVTDCFVVPPEGAEVSGYEIHTGRTVLGPGAKPLMRVESRDGQGVDIHHDVYDGAVSADGLTVGTYFHGLFDNASARNALLTYLFRKKALQAPPMGDSPMDDARMQREDAYNRLADVMRTSLDIPRIYDIMGLRAK